MITLVSNKIRSMKVTAVLAGMMLFGAHAWGQAVPPEFNVQFLFSNGLPTAVNERGDAVGWVTVGGVSRAWVAVAGSSGSLLPDGGASSSRANDISDDGVIVGHAGANAVAWLPPDYTAPVVLKKLSVTERCEAIAVNRPTAANGNARDVVGYCAFPGFIGGPGTLWAQVNGAPALGSVAPVNLTNAAGLFSIRDVNDGRQVVADSSVFDLDDLSISPVPIDLDGNLPPEFVTSLLFAINEPTGGVFGQVAGYARIGTSLPDNRKIVRNDNGTWEVLSGPGVYNTAYGIDSDGNLSVEYTAVCASSANAVIATGVYFDAIGSIFCADDLLAAASRDWLIGAPNFDNDIDINPATGMVHVVTTASNPATGLSGAVLLTQGGVLPAPAPVTNFACRPSEDPLGIFCDWLPGDDLTNSYSMERKTQNSLSEPFSEVCTTSVPQCFDLTTQGGVTYEYRVRACGLGGCSDWEYTSATAPDTPPPPSGTGAIGDLTWEDSNGDGIQHRSEPGLAGVKVELLKCGAAMLKQTFSGAGGKYMFENLPADRYQLRFTAPAGYVFSPQGQGPGGKDSDANQNGMTACMNLADGQSRLGIDAGLVPDGGPGGGGTAEIGNYVWVDTDGDGIQDGRERGLAGVLVELLNCDGTSTGTQATSDNRGRYLLGALAAGSYKVRFAAQAGYAYSPQTQGRRRGKDSDPDPSSGTTACIPMADGQSRLGIDAGYMPQ